jgi:hypothetical protein
MRLGTMAARATIARLLRSREPRDSTEASWNWRDARLRIEETLKARGHSCVSVVWWNLLVMVVDGVMSGAKGGGSSGEGG